LVRLYVQKQKKEIEKGGYLSLGWEGESRQEKFQTHTYNRHTSCSVLCQKGQNAYILERDNFDANCHDLLLINFNLDTIFFPCYMLVDSCHLNKNTGS
jgi:hypothetical protein